MLHNLLPELPDHTAAAQHPDHDHNTALQDLKSINLVPVTDDIPVLIHDHLHPHDRREHINMLIANVTGLTSLAAHPFPNDDVLLAELPDILRNLEVQPSHVAYFNFGAIRESVRAHLSL